ncbi:hypothetical protein [Propionispira raffinosivorans]|uniref:hypothetical protein n=1 Tax=Propionispira raffinosivorans TaxID=86959 RepID=UPI00035F4F61|nr:hypothetical protein [Propionispira raffinosivorans]
MLQIFEDVEKQKIELEKLLINAQTSEIIYRQKNEIKIANRLKILEKQLRIAVKSLEDSMILK